MRKQQMEYLAYAPALCSLIEDNDIEPDNLSELADSAAAGIILRHDMTP